MSAEGSNAGGAGADVDLTARREANEQLAAAQSELEREQQADRVATAERIRQGAEPGTIAPKIGKLRNAVELAERNAGALALAVEGVQDDLAATMRQHADTWLAALDGEGERARQQALAALDAFDDAVRTLREAAFAASWVRGALDDDRWDRQPRAMLVGSVAPSSRRLTANNEPIAVPDLVGYLRESIDEPQPIAVATTVDTALPVETAAT